MTRPVEYRFGRKTGSRSSRYSTGLAPWNKAVNEKINCLWQGYSIGRAAKTQSTPSINEITNSKHEIRNSKQKGKTQNTNFKTFKNAGQVLIGRFWILRIEILKLFRISIFGFRIFPQIVSDFDF